MKLPATRRRRSSILLISLVDVLFVLLLFFLLTAQALAPQRLPLALDVAAAAPGAQLQLVGPGRVRLAGDELPLAQATARLQAAGVRDVQLLAGDRITSAVWFAALEALRDAGLAPVVGATP
jgi:biopolymer transport protein ExbD